MLGILWPTLLLPAAEAEKAGNRQEDWYRVVLNGKPAGFIRQTQEDAPGGGFATTVLERLIVRRGAEPAPVTMEVESRVEEDPAGAVRRFRLVQRMASEDQVTEGVVRGSALEITSGSAAEPRRSSVPFDPRAIGPHRLEEVLSSKLLREGDVAEVTTFFPEKGSCGSVTATRGKEGPVEVPGGTRTLVSRTSRMSILPGIDMKEWVDAEGKVWRSELPLPGFSLETFLSSAAEIAKEKYASPPEVFLST